MHNYGNETTGHTGDGPTEEHKGLPVQGYKPTQPDWAIAIVNENKVLDERILRQIDRHKDKGADIDQRHVAIARTEIEKAFMSLNRAVFQPQRIKLPDEDFGGGQ